MQRSSKQPKLDKIVLAKAADGGNDDDLNSPLPGARKMPLAAADKEQASPVGKFPLPLPTCVQGIYEEPVVSLRPDDLAPVDLDRTLSLGPDDDVPMLKTAQAVVVVPLAASSPSGRAAAAEYDSDSDDPVTMEDMLAQAIDPDFLADLDIQMDAFECLRQYVTDVVLRCVRELPPDRKLISFEMVDRAVASVEADVRKAKAKKKKQKHKEAGSSGRDD